MNIMTSLHSNFDKYNGPIGNVIPGLVFRYNPTSLTDKTTAFTGETLTFNGNTTVALLNSEYWAYNVNSGGSPSNNVTFTNDFTLGNTWTIMTQIIITALSPAADFISIGTSNTSYNPIASIRARSVYSTLTGIIYASGQILSASTGLSLNTTYHCALSYDGTHLSFYVNGTLIGTPTSVSNTWSSNTPNEFKLMAPPTSTGGYCYGYGREFRIYNIALTQSQIQQAYNGIV